MTAITTDTGVSGADGITSDNTLVLSGTAEANASVEVFLDAVSLGTVTANGAGTWSFDHTGTTLADADLCGDGAGDRYGGQCQRVVGGLQRDGGYRGPCGERDRDHDGYGCVGRVDGITSDNTLVLSGTAEANASVEVFLDAVSLGTVTANGAGTWSFDHTGTTLADAAYVVTAQATDTAGNVGRAVGGLQRDGGYGRTGRECHGDHDRHGCVGCRWDYERHHLGVERHRGGERVGGGVPGCGEPRHGDGERGRYLEL